MVQINRFLEQVDPLDAQELGEPWRIEQGRFGKFRVA